MIIPQPEPATMVLKVPITVFKAARCHFDRLEYEKAIGLLDPAIENATILGGSDSVTVYDCWILMAQCYFWGGDYLATKAIVRSLCSFDHSTDDGWNSVLPGCMINMVNGHYLDVVTTLDPLICKQIESQNLGVSELMLYRGRALLRLGRLDAAHSDFQIGHSLARLLGSFRLQAEHANFLGILNHTVGRFRRALEWYEASLGIGREVNSTLSIGRLSQNLGICHYRLGDYPTALGHLDTAVAHLQEASDSLNLCRAHIAIACVHRWLRDFETARQHLSQAYTMASELTAAREECLALEFLGDVFRDEGRHAEARRYYRRGVAIAETIAPDGDLVCELLRREGECLVQEGDTDAGLDTLARALAHARKLGDRAEEGIVLRCLAEGFLQAGEHDRALAYAEEACTLLEELDTRHEHAIARLVAGEILLQQSSIDRAGDPRDSLDKAWNHSIIAQGIILKLGIDYWTEAVKQLQVQIVKRRQEEHRRQVDGTSVFQDSLDDDLSLDLILGPPQVVIAESQAMQDVLQTAEAYAPYDQTVLLTGETGTGKELIAHLLHRHSGRRDRQMVTVNITAFPASLFDREFFGHARGAFTGADSDSWGLAACADGNTLFLDEIGELPPEVQVKLLRLLQNGSYMRLGDPSEQRTDLRIIASTNRDLKKAVKEGRFRKDLYYRLSSMTIHIPPLRKRREDILPLMEHYLSLSAKRTVTVDQYFNDLSQKLLVRYGWPGNVREVIQVAHRAHVSKQRLGRIEVVLGDGSDLIQLTGPGARAKVAVAGGKDRRSLSRAHVLLALEESGGNRSETARKLGISRTALYRCMDKFGITD